MTHISDIKLKRTDATLDLSQKVKKGIIRNWRALECPAESVEFSSLKIRICALHAKAEDNSITHTKIEERDRATAKIIEIERVACLDAKQRYRIKWVSDGDENSSFFHGYMRNKNRKNFMHGLMIDGVGRTILCA